MAPKKRKADPAESDAAAEPTTTNHHQEPTSAELKPCGTIYFPITDDPLEPTAEVAATEEDDCADEEDIAKLLERLSREQLVALLRTAAEASPVTMAAVLHAAEADLASRKLFVHCLGWGASAADLCSAFSRFSELEDCRVISDKQSGRSKGYGFVLFRSRRSALRRPQFQIGGCLALCHLAASGPALPASQSQNPSSNTNTNATNANSGTANNPSATSSSQPDNMLRWGSKIDRQHFSTRCLNVTICWTLEVLV